MGTALPSVHLTARWRRAAVSASALGLVLGGLILGPRLVSAYWTDRGVGALRRSALVGDKAAWAEAERALSQALAWHGDNGRAYRLLGELALWRGDIEASEPLLARAVALAPHDGYAWFFLGGAAWQLGRTEDAAAAWVQAAHSLGGLPFYLDRQRRGANEGDGQWRLNMADTPEVRLMIKRVAEAAVAGGERRVWLYLLIAGLSESRAEALSWLEEGRRANPGSWVPVAVLAEAAFRRGDYALSRSLWQEAIAKSPPRADYEFALAQTYEAEGRLEEALAAYERALDIAPDNQRYQAKAREIQEILKEGKKGTNVNGESP